MTIYNQIIKEGLWKNNPALVQLLGLCPLLAVTNTLINGLGLGLATIDPWHLHSVNRHQLFNHCPC